MASAGWAVRVYGTPVAQGSMKCVGRNGRHQLVDTKAKLLKSWREAVSDAGQRLMAHHDAQPLDKAVGIDITFTVARPKSVKPESRVWPFKKAARTADGGGDLDKLIRAVGDALSTITYLDDAQICELHVYKAYPDSPAPNTLDRPGAQIRVYPLDDEPELF